MPSDPGCRPDLDIPFLYHAAYVSDVSGTPGMDGSNGVDGMDGTSGCPGSMDPEQSICGRERF